MKKTITFLFLIGLLGISKITNAQSASTTGGQIIHGTYMGTVVNEVLINDHNIWYKVINPEIWLSGSSFRVNGPIQKALYTATTPPPVDWGTNFRPTCGSAKSTYGTGNVVCGTATQVFDSEGNAFMDCPGETDACSARLGGETGESIVYFLAD